MTLDQIRIFLAVIKCGNISKAAEEVYLTHPAVSRSMSNLEKELGLQLMERTKRGIRLTTAGEMFRRKADRIIEAVDEMQLEMSNLKEHINGQISICTPPMSHEMDLLMDCCRVFKKIYPQVQIMLSESDVVYDSVLIGKVDIGVAHDYVIYNDSGIEKLTIYTDRFCIVVGDTHPLAERKSVTGEELRGYCLMTFKSDDNDKLGTKNAFNFMTNLENRIKFGENFSGKKRQFSTFREMMFNVKLGEGVAFLPESLAKTALEGCRILNIEDESVNFSFDMIWKKDNTTPAVKSFVDIAREIVRNYEIKGSI